MITGTAGMWTAEERLAAFVETMEAAGVAVDPSLCVAGNYRGDAAYEATKPLMTRADRPTAIIGANNVMALGALAGDPRSRIQLPGRCLAGRHRRRALERTCAAARHDVGAADRRYRAGGDRLPARTDVRWSRGPRPAARPGVPAAFPVRRFMRLAASGPDRRVGLTRRVRAAAMAKPGDDGPATGAGESPVSLAGARRQRRVSCDATLHFSALPASPMKRAIRRHS